MNIKEQGRLKQLQELEPIYEEALKYLEKYVHPHHFFRKEGKTLADYHKYFGQNIKTMNATIKDAEIRGFKYENL